MAEEEQRRKLDRLKGIRRGHHGVLTKLTREVNKIVSEAEGCICGSSTKVSRLNLIYEQLDANMLHIFTNLDGEIVSCTSEEIGELKIPSTLL